MTTTNTQALTTSLHYARGSFDYEAFQGQVSAPRVVGGTATGLAMLAQRIGVRVSLAQAKSRTAGGWNVIPMASEVAPAETYCPRHDLFDCWFCA